MPLNLCFLMPVYTKNNLRLLWIILRLFSTLYSRSGHAVFYGEGKFLFNPVTGSAVGRFDCAFIAHHMEREFYEFRCADSMNKMSFHRSNFLSFQRNVFCCRIWLLKTDNFSEFSGISVLSTLKIILIYSLYPLKNEEEVEDEEAGV